MKFRIIIQSVAVFALLGGSVLPAVEVNSLADLKEIELKTKGLAKQVMPASVALISTSTGASGSGVIVNESGLILTAAHVTDGAKEVQVVFADGKETKAKVLGSNFSKDAGMAQITEPGPWPFVDIGTSDDLEAGDWVVAMGHSEGFDPARTPPLRFGRVVSTGPGKYLTTDCTLIGGDSGGPLFDLEGRVVAINSSIGQTLDNNNHTGIDGFREDWQRLASGETWGELQLNPLANPERPVIGILMGYELRDGGVPIDRVTPGSPAATAGLKRGDIIRSVDGEVVKGGRNLGHLLVKFSAGDEVEIGIQRGRKMHKVKLVLVRQDQLYKQKERR